MECVKNQRPEQNHFASGAVVLAEVSVSDCIFDRLEENELYWYLL